MKNRILAIVGLALLAAVSASAQDSHTNPFKVPFPFVVGETTLPAATYTVRFTSKSGTVMLRSHKCGNFITLSTPNGYLPEKADLDNMEFQRFGNIWILKQVRIAGYEHEVRISNSRQAESATVNAPAQPMQVAAIP
jgi:hypothetical protein